MFKLLWEILKDQRGFWGAVAGTVLGSKLAKDKGSTDVYDPYADLRKKWQDTTMEGLGKSTSYSQNPAFNIQQPGVEKAAESTILGKLNSPGGNVKDYSAATKQYSDAAKASMQESYDRERVSTNDMYNRLGLVSSTPGLSAIGDVNESQRIAENTMDADLMYKNLDRELSAQGLDVNELNSILGQAGNLGQTQRAGQQYSQGMSMQDIQRQLAEKMGYGAQAASILGQTPPEQTYNPSFLEQLMGLVSKVAPQVAGAATTSMLSDMRLKDNITDTGKRYKGLKIYTWNWKKWVSDTIKKNPTIGFIAQEVQKVKPEAIKVTPDGYLSINYSMI